jgi:ACT domain-containing protein
MVLSVENFIQLYRTLKKGDERKDIEKQLKQYDISREQFLNYVNFVDDLELNEKGIRVMYHEIQNGHLKL